MAYQDIWDLLLKCDSDDENEGEANGFGDNRHHRVALPASEVPPDGIHERCASFKFPEHTDNSSSGKPTEKIDSNDVDKLRFAIESQAVSNTNCWDTDDQSEFSSTEDVLSFFATKPRAEVDNAGNGLSSSDAEPSIQGDSASAIANTEGNILDSFRRFANDEESRSSYLRWYQALDEKAVAQNDDEQSPQRSMLTITVPNKFAPLGSKDGLSEQEPALDTLEQANKATGLIDNDVQVASYKSIDGKDSISTMQVRSEAQTHYTKLLEAGQTNGKLHLPASKASTLDMYRKQSSAEIAELKEIIPQLVKEAEHLVDEAKKAENTDKIKTQSIKSLDMRSGSAVQANPKSTQVQDQLVEDLMTRLREQEDHITKLEKEKKLAGERITQREQAHDLLEADLAKHIEKQAGQLKSLEEEKAVAAQHHMKAIEAKDKVLLDLASRMEKDYQQLLELEEDEEQEVSDLREHIEKHVEHIKSLEDEKALAAEDMAKDKEAQAKTVRDLTDLMNEKDAHIAFLDKEKMIAAQKLSDFAKHSEKQAQHVLDLKNEKQLASKESAKRLEAAEDLGRRWEKEAKVVTDLLQKKELEADQTSKRLVAADEKLEDLEERLREKDTEIGHLEHQQQLTTEEFHTLSRGNNEHMKALRDQMDKQDSDILDLTHRLSQQDECIKGLEHEKDLATKEVTKMTKAYKESVEWSRTIASSHQKTIMNLHGESLDMRAEADDLYARLSQQIKIGNDLNDAAVKKDKIVKDLATRVEEQQTAIEGMIKRSTKQDKVFKDLNAILDEKDKSAQDLIACFDEQQTATKRVLKHSDEKDKVIKDLNATLAEKDALLKDVVIAID